MRRWQEGFHYCPYHPTLHGDVPFFDTETSLSRETLDGQAITGTDVIQTVGSSSNLVAGEPEENLPEDYTLGQNYPNPFNPTTTIRYSMKEDTRVTIKIYNNLGQEIATLVNEFQSAGFKSVVWDGKNDMGHPVSSGIYLYRIQAGDFSEVKKMSLIR